MGKVAGAGAGKGKGGKGTGQGKGNIRKRLDKGVSTHKINAQNEARGKAKIQAKRKKLKAAGVEKGSDKWKSAMKQRRGNVKARVEHQNVKTEAIAKRKKQKARLSKQVHKGNIGLKAAAAKRTKLLKKTRGTIKDSKKTMIKSSGPRQAARLRRKKEDKK